MSAGHSQRFMGKSWLTMLQPGRYRVSYRAKWTAFEPDQFWKAYLYVSVPNQEDGKERTFFTNVASSNCWATERGEAFLGKPANYARLASPGSYAYYAVDVEVRFPTYVSASAIVDTNRDGDHRFYLDHIKITCTEPYSDRTLEKWLKVTKPGDAEAVLDDVLTEVLDEDAEPTPAADLGRKLQPLRVPRGAAPEKILEVRGVHARLYRVSDTLGCEIAYDLPGDYRSLYAYDAVVLANFDLAFTSWQQRRMLHDFVKDGGRLVVLGGISTLGHGAMQNTYVEEMLPVRLTGDREVVKCAAPVPLGPAPGEAYEDGAALDWRHAVDCADDVQIVAYAGEAPIAAMHGYDNGTVGVFTGTVLGRMEGATPFWERDSWTRLLRELVGRD
jgi:hypothetical protein